MTQYEFTVNGLNCANCAKKIESKISRIEGTKDVSLNFAMKKLSLKSKETDASKILMLINKIADDIEPGVYARMSRSTCTKEKNKKTPISYIPTAFAVGVFIAAMVFKLPQNLSFGAFLSAYLIIGYGVLFRAAKNILRGEIFDENFLMSIATIGAFIIGEYPEGIAVMLFYRIGQFFENTAVEKSRKSISSLMDIRPDFAELKKGEKTVRVFPEEVKVEDIIVVMPGEKIPLDGIIIEGSSTVDTSALTGESLLRDVKVNDEVLSGSINKTGLLSVKVTKVFAESTVSKILNLVENAGANKSRTENFITRFARYYTPAVVFAALIIAVIPPLFIEGMPFSDWVYRALLFLVVSCPCALVVSVPLTFFGGIGGASRNGILVKGGNYLEALADASAFVFDKTGTLTKGIFKVSKINTMSSYNEKQILEYAAYAESYSNHPIALSIIKAYESKIDRSAISDYKEYAGLGISATIKGKKILAGNIDFLEQNAIKIDKVDEYGTTVYIVVDGVYIGNLIVSDEIKSDAKTTVEILKKEGKRKIVMLTGDIKKTGEEIASRLGISEVYTNLLPGDKIEKLRKIKQSVGEKGKIVFVGDGINDAPVLAGSDIGIAMGAMGSDAAIEAADIVLMTDEPSKIITALKISEKTKSIVWQNIIFALGVKIAVLISGAFGAAMLWEAVFADVGTMVLAVLNSIRTIRAPK